MRRPIGPFSVSAIGFGAMRLTGPGVFGPPSDRDEALAVLREAVDSGVDHIDTAQFYGPDVVNELIREALYPYPENLILVSKVARGGTGRAVSSPPKNPPNSAKASRRTCKRSASPPFTWSTSG